ncbi:CPBP family intramembrane glutamic endopeptidase [Pedobacter sp. SL55]|uniref:CPBP family intramembrane glutamic endopeptidase n=1 Tax=Pedobacter sp. SL55 TaxID=2995161 RepID=UPI00226F119D|nr:type II CAAX endopeptidase family protein [Pedobacter sp. SL55]WAC39608.1 type II CAAX endopeptidase family protein [Pedobacter sp. SL55]
MIEDSKLGYYLVPVLKIWLFMFFLLLCTIPFGLVLQFNFLPSISTPIVSDIIAQFSLVTIVLGALLMVFKVFPDLDFYQVFIKRASALPEFFKGVALGLVLMLLCALLLYVNGNVVFEKANISGDMVCLYFLYFLMISVFEEFLFRSYPLFALAERYPLWFAILVNGLLFAFAHFANPGITVLGALNITLAGMLFALYTLQKRNIAWAVGVHFAWNFTQAVVLGYNLSGNKMSGFVKAVPKGLDYFSGGEFGIEGSVVCTVFLIGSISWLFYSRGFGFSGPSIQEDNETE